MAALTKGQTVAIANKEPLVSAGLLLQGKQMNVAPVFCQSTVNTTQFFNAGVVRASAIRN